MTSSGGLLLDASVLVELTIDGRYRAGAERILDQIARVPDQPILSAAHGLVEAVSVLRRLERTETLSPTEAARAIHWLHALDLTLDPPGPRLDRAWSLRHTMTAYDAMYAAAADSTGLPLITADTKLLRACDAAAVNALHVDDALLT